MASINPNTESNKTIKLVLKTILYIILLILFCFLYMKDALSQFREGKTTMSEMRKKIVQIENREAPVLIICPEPGFKASFFNENDVEKSFRKFFWKFIWKCILTSYSKSFQNPLGIIWQNIQFYSSEQYANCCDDQYFTKWFDNGIPRTKKVIYTWTNHHFDGLGDHLFCTKFCCIDYWKKYHGCRNWTYLSNWCNISCWNISGKLSKNIFKCN